MSLGIGIITRNRRDQVLQVVDAVRRHTTCAYELVVGVDHTSDDTVAVLADAEVRTVQPRDRGIPANRNAVLAALRHHEAIIVLEDDHLPIRDGWQAPYVQTVTQTPVKVLWHLHDAHGPLVTRTYATETGPLTVGWRPNMGCTLVALHRSVLDVVGAWNPAFRDRYGLDDGTWAVRCVRAGLTDPTEQMPAGYPCLPNARDLTGDIDAPSSDGKSLEEREADIAVNWPLWESRFTDPIHIPLPTLDELTAADETQEPVDAAVS